MHKRFLFLCLLGTALLGFAPTSFAQVTTDLITEIDGEGFVSAEQTRYFNAANCESPPGIPFQERITTSQGTAVSQVFLWVGQENSKCDLEENRTDITNRCRPVAGGAAQTLDTNNLIDGLTLADLTDTGLVDCANTALQGQPYELYAFRNQAPGSDNVPSEGYGIAYFKVDVTPPNPPDVTNDVPGSGQSFELKWNQPTDAIQLYRFYRNDVDDPETASVIEGVTASLNSTSQGFTAEGLNLALGESAYLYVTAVDMAAPVPGDGNEGDKSIGWQVTATETFGFCDASGSCTGCAASPMVMTAGGPSSAAWVLVMLCALGYARRRRR